jgi:methyl-accepting chemotaxis protein
MDFEKVNEQIERTDASITKLEKASIDIGESTKMINSIAKQTSMLAVCRQRNVCQSRYFLRDTFDL